MVRVKRNCLVPEGGGGSEGGREGGREGKGDDNMRR